MAYTGSTLLSLPVITTGTESGKWGDITNNGLTQYLDISIAGALSITSSVTLANTAGTDAVTNIGATTAQYRTLVVPASGPSAPVVITAPSSNRTYHVVNRNATHTVQIRAGANSGVTFGVNQSGTVTYNAVSGDYELVGTIGPTVPVARGGTGLTSGTSGGVLYYSATGTLASSGALAANALVIGGGAGVAPSTTTTGANVLTFLGTPSSANLAAAVTDETGSGSLVFATSPSLTTPLLGTPTSGNLSNCTADGTNSVGFKKVPQSGSAKTTSYTLTTSDVGKFIEVGSGGSITIPDATFAAGDAILVFNNTSGSITITCTITTAYIAGTDADKATVSLATRGIASILFASGTVCTITGNVS